MPALTPSRANSTSCCTVEINSAEVSYCDKSGKEFDVLANILKVAPPYEMTDEEFLDQAEAEIRCSDKRVISEIVAIGRKLIEIKNRVGHGRYGQFIRDRLWFSERSAQQFVQSYEFLKSAHCADFESLDLLRKSPDLFS